MEISNGHTATFLCSESKAPQSKTRSLNECGKWIKAGNYPKTYQFTRHPFQIPNDIDELYTLLSTVPTSYVLTLSIPTGDIPLDQPARRLSCADGDDPATVTIPTGTTLFCLDIDGCELAEPLDAFDPVPQISSVIDETGMGDCSFVWQLSSTAEHGNRYLKCHVFFIMDKPLPLPVLRNAASVLGADKSVFDMNHLIYIAPPIHIGGIDPIPKRWGVVHGEQELIPAHLIESLASQAEVKVSAGQYAGNKSGIFYGGLNQIFGYMGDGDGLRGFHEPLRKYILLAVKERYGPKAIKRKCREAIQAAPKSPGRNTDEIERYLSDEYLDDSIGGASKYLKNVDELPARHATPEQTKPISLAEANIKIQQLIANYFLNPTATVLKVTVGTGKTWEAVRKVVEWLVNNPNSNIAWFAPTHKQAIEVERLFNQLLPDSALRIKGYLHQDGDEPPLCDRGNVVKACQDAGFGSNIKKLCCQDQDEEGNIKRECPFRQRCKYHLQFQQTHRVRIFPHAMLNRPEASGFTWGDWGQSIQFVIVDESPIDTTIGHSNHTLTSVQALGGAIAEAVTHCISNTAPSDPEILAVRIEKQINEQMIETLPKISPNQPDRQILTSIATFKQNPFARFSDFATQLSKWVRGEINSVWMGKTTVKNERCFNEEVDAVCYAWKSPSEKLDRALILDAVAQEDIYRAVLGDELNFVEINVDQDLYIVQIKDELFSKNALENEQLITRIAGLATILDAGVITHKVTEEILQDQLSKIPSAAAIPTGHFNALRGLNVMKELPALIIAGRIEPPAQAIEAMARSLWPTEKLKFVDKCDRYEWQQGDYGGVAGHTDQRIDSVLRSIREGEMEQAAGRLRAVRSSETKLLIIATNSPCPLSVDKAVYTDDILPDHRMAQIILRDGVFIQSDDYLAKIHPDLFKTKNEAHCWIRRSGFKGVACFKKNFSVKGTTPLKLFNFRVEGQRGSLAKGITWKSEVETREIIKSLMGKAVTTYQLDDLLPEIEAEVVTMQATAKNDPDQLLVFIWEKPTYRIVIFKSTNQAISNQKLLPKPGYPTLIEFKPISKSAD